MKKLSLAAIIVTVSISLAGCTNSETASNGNKTNTESTTQNSTESNVQNSSESSTENNNVNNAQNNTVNNPQDNNTNNAQNNIVNNTGNISLDKAKEIALSHAGLSADQVTFVQANMDFDDGIQKYDIKFYCNGQEYDYEINSSNGQIVQFDYDMEYNYIPNNNTTNYQSNVNTTANISVERAKEIALSHAGLASNQVTFQRIELDFDNGIQKYEIEFYYNYREYSYEIDANTGNILSYEQD
ncbi:PepSY domain-containing protein [uncultured Clostridium sp.]|uniref:PepSY domain-containing protein n=1 Tax=uncultured Clostridium sp. TaxID=59620 RepID=UPI0027DB1BEF|nr:PepSY domain-containing protein [uncultured Clostridium sp.]